MGKRRILVIGSQCKKHGTLSFLPGVAVRFHALMVGNGPGECTAVDRGEPAGLLLNPSVEECESAIRDSLQQAARDGDTLLLVYIGHGECVEKDFYLLPFDANLDE
jgi:hypothetical protein